MPAGYQFAGWSEEIVTEDMIVNAVYNKEKYTVVFMDPFGEAVSTQTVEYGKTAAPPDTQYMTAPEGMAIKGWSAEENWWAVDKDMVITPIVGYEEAADSPSVELEYVLSDDVESEEAVEPTFKVSIVSATENAQIYYTLDGTEPELEETGSTMLYTEPFEIRQIARVNAVATAERMNASEVAVFDLNMEDEEEAGETDSTLYIENADVAAISNKAYTGSAIKPSPTVTWDGEKLVKGTDYELSYENNKKVGTATITITGLGNYAGTKTVTFKIVKAKQPMTAKAVAKTVSYSKVKSKNQTVSGAITVKKAQGKVTYTKKSGSSKFTINKTTGKITVKKGTKKGTYKIKVTVKAAGNAGYKAGSKVVTATIKVK